jgi:hypothetical protein
VKFIKDSEIHFQTDEDTSMINKDGTFTINNGNITINGETMIADQIILDTTTGLLLAYDYSINGEAKSFEDSKTWYEQTLKDVLPHFYPRESKDPTIPTILGAEKYEDKASVRTVYFIAEPTSVGNTFMSLSSAPWEAGLSQQAILDRYQEDIRYQTQRYTAGLLKDRGFAGYLDGLTASPDVPIEIFPDALEAANEIKDVTLKQQLVTLVETRSKTPKEDQPIFATTEHSVNELSGTITSKPSPDGKNRISGRIMVNGEPASFATIGISIPLDAAVDLGLAIANTGSNKEGAFSFMGFAIPSGDYVISVEHENISLYNFLPFSITEQELEINLHAVKNFKTLEPKSGATVTTTPTLSWESVPDVARYVITIHDNDMKEQFVYQMTEATTLTLELPLESRKNYVWSVSAHDKSGRPINLSDFSKFSTK